MGQVMALQGSAIGFKTDKDQGGGYPESTVRDCLIEATLAGVYPVGNEFNIIAGRAYITKEGMGRKLRDIDGLSYSILPGVPSMKEGGAIVPMNVEWTFKGNSSKRELPICVKVNGGMGADAVIGKATRKARAWLYQTVTGSEIPDGEAEAGEINVTPKISPFEAAKPAEAVKSQAPTTPIPDDPELAVEEAEAIIGEIIDIEKFSAWFALQPQSKGLPSLRQLCERKAGVYRTICRKSSIVKMANAAKEAAQ
jgi:hypothetical protein